MQNEWEEDEKGKNEKKNENKRKKQRKKEESLDRIKGMPRRKRLTSACTNIEVWCVSRDHCLQPPPPSPSRSPARRWLEGKVGGAGGGRVSGGRGYVIFIR